MEKEYKDQYLPNEYDTIQFDDGYIKLFSQEDERNLTSSEILQQTLEHYPDHWISENRLEIEHITKDIFNMSGLNTLGDKAEYSDVADYLEYTNTTEIESKINWNDDDDLSFYVIRCPNKRNPSNMQFMRHFLMELSELYDYLCRTYFVNFGPFEIFCDFIYVNSSSALRIPED